MVCDTRTAVNPRYLDILERADGPLAPVDVDSLLASAITVDAYAMSRGGEITA
jgi:hypothetical protein